MEVVTAPEKDINCSAPEISTKKKKLSGDERLHRNRERNRMHARKTRERKKQQSTTLLTRIGELQDEGTRLRQIVDDRYTASVLLGLSQTFQDSSGENHNILSSVNICKNAYAVALAQNNWFGDNAASGTPTAPKRVRRRGKYTPQERERIRRERNRMHAKRTRDRKKELVEVSEAMIGEMETESQALREYLVSLKLLSVEDAEKSEERATESKKELAALKASQNEYDLDGDDDDDDDHFNDDNGDGDDEHDGSLSGSDDNEKGSWSGSNNGNDSINGDTSGDGTASTGSINSSSHNAPSSSGSSHSHNSSGSGSGSGSDSPTSKHQNMDWGKPEKTPCLFNYGTKSSGSFKVGTNATSCAAPQVGVAYSPRAAGSKKSQSVESYNHGGVVAVNEEAKAVEKAAYHGYSHQQAQDKHFQASGTGPTGPVSIAPSSSNSATAENAALSVQAINATLAAADYYQGNIQHEQALPAGWHYPPLRPIATTPAEPMFLPHSLIAKVPNILLSVIPQGVLAPRSAGGISPRGMFSPIDPVHSLVSLTPALFSPVSSAAKFELQSSNASIMSGFADISQSQSMFQRDCGPYRNLPSSNIANGHSPL